MEDRRQVFRRKPTEVVLEAKAISVAPLPWLQRDEFANEVVRQNAEILNEGVKLWFDDTDGGALPVLQAKFAEKWTDPYALLRLAVPGEDWTAPWAQALYTDEIVEILVAACDVNKLDTLKALVDPNSPTPDQLFGNLSSLLAPGENGQKIESSPDSSSQDSLDQPSSSSPTQK
jgi:hypothetical protein